MRSKFDLQLDKLNTELTEMGNLCESAIAAAVSSIFGSDKALANEAIEAEKEIDRKERDIESLCMRLLLQQQPVAHDLRTVSSALKMITDMERIGDQASDIAEIAEYAAISKGKCRDDISSMAFCVIDMVNNSINAFVNRDLALAEKIDESDNIADGLFTEIKSDLVALITKNPENGETALDTLMIAKYLERIGDHAVNIAEWVIYSITGRHVDES